MNSSSTRSKRILPSNKPKPLASVTRNTLYTDTRQSDESSRSSAKKSARQLYFYKSPTNAQILRAKNGEASSTLKKLGKDVSEIKAEVADSDKATSILAKVNDRSTKNMPRTNNASKKDPVVDLYQDFDGEALNHGSTNSLEVQAASITKEKKQRMATTTDQLGDYRSKIQGIRKNRSSTSLSAGTPSESPESKVQPRVSNASRATSLSQLFLSVFPFFVLLMWLRTVYCQNSSS